MNYKFGLLICFFVSGSAVAIKPGPPERFTGPIEINDDSIQNKSPYIIAARSAVGIAVYDHSVAPAKFLRFGTGVLLKGGVILTAAHNAFGNDATEAERFTKGLLDGQIQVYAVFGGKPKSSNDIHLRRMNSFSYRPSYIKYLKNKGPENRNEPNPSDIFMFSLNGGIPPNYLSIEPNYNTDSLVNGMDNIVLAAGKGRERIDSPAASNSGYTNVARFDRADIEIGAEFIIVDQENKTGICVSDSGSGLKVFSPTENMAYLVGIALSVYNRTEDRKTKDGCDTGVFLHLANDNIRRWLTKAYGDLAPPGMANIFSPNPKATNLNAP